jgi:hypothetical protein
MIVGTAESGSDIRLGHHPSLGTVHWLAALPVRDLDGEGV